THRCEIGRRQFCRRAAFAFDCDLRTLCGFDDQRARRDHACDFRVAKLIEEAKDVAIDRFLPDVAAIVEKSADDSRVNARIERASTKRNETALTPANHADFGWSIRGGALQA